MFNGERLFEESYLIEKHPYFPEIYLFWINFNSNLRIKFFRSKIVDIDFVVIDAEDRLDDNILFDDDVFRLKRRVNMTLLFDESHKFEENTD